MTVANSSQLYLHQTIPVVEGDVIDGIAACYNTFAFAPVDRPPFITAILLTEVLFPQSSTGGAVNLALQLNFDAFDPRWGRRLHRNRSGRRPREVMKVATRVKKETSEGMENR
jgi:hypothetical protein